MKYSRRPPCSWWLGLPWRWRKSACRRRSAHFWPGWFSPRANTGTSSSQISSLSKGLLLGLFFISVGSSIDLPLVQSQPLMMLGLVLSLLIVKFFVLFFIGKVTRLEKSQNFTFAFALAQGGEFAFVLISFAAQNQVIDMRIGNLLVATVALSMVAAPFLFTINERLVQPLFSSQLTNREADEIDEKDNPVILAGFGRFGHIVGRVLNLQGIKTTVLDLDAEQVELVRKLGAKVFYGDASRLELLHAAGADKAKLLIVAIDDEEKSLLIIDTAHKHFPNLKILARAAGRDHAYRLLSHGVEHIFRETLGSSLDLSVAALRMLGFRAYEAHRAAKAFRDYDEQTVRELAPFSEDPVEVDRPSQETDPQHGRIVRDGKAPDPSIRCGMGPAKRFFASFFLSSSPNRPSPRARPRPRTRFFVSSPATAVKIEDEHDNEHD